MRIYIYVRVREKIGTLRLPLRANRTQDSFGFNPLLRFVTAVYRSSMAFHKHVKLPPLRLTRRCGSDVQVRCVHRGVSLCSSQAVSPESQQRAVDDSKDPDVIDTFHQSEESDPLPEPSDHQLHAEAFVRNWEKLRRSILLKVMQCQLISPASFATSWQSFVVVNVDQ